MTKLDSIDPQRIADLSPWFHNLHLPDGTQTAPNHSLGDFPTCKWRRIEPHLPDVRGWKVLDVGCNAGFYSFELARRGAQVTALDIDEHYLRQAEWAAHVYDLTERVTFRKASVYDLAGERERFDLVWFMGVFYHLRYPLLALDILRQVCKGSMVFQTMTAPGDDVLETRADYGLDQRDVLNDHGWPKLAFIEHRVANDPTNWWAPNHAAVLALLRAAGFANVERVAHEIYRCEARGSPPVVDELFSATDRRPAAKE